MAVAWPVAAWAGNSWVKVDAGRVTIHAESASLPALLRELADQAALRIVVYRPSDDPVAVEFKDLPLEQAVEVLMRDTRGGAMVFEEDRTGLRRLVKVYMVLNGDAGSIEELGRKRSTIEETKEPAYSPDPVPLETAERYLRNGDPGEFLTSLTVFYPGVKPQDALYLALSHPDPSVRSNGLSVLAEVGSGDRARRALEEAADDPDPTVRGLARRLLYGHDAAD